MSSFNAFGQTAQIAAVSGRDELALYDLATGADESSRWVERPHRPRKRRRTLESNCRKRGYPHRPQAPLRNRQAALVLAGGNSSRAYMYLSPAIEGRQYVVVLNDGNERSTPKGERPKDSTLLLIDATQASPTFLKSAGETPGSTLAITRSAFPSSGPALPFPILRTAPMSSQSTIIRTRPNLRRVIAQILVFYGEPTCHTSSNTRRSSQR